MNQKLLLGDTGGRYLNGTAFLNLSVTNGVLDLKASDVLVNGKSLPGEFTGSLKSMNLADQANQNAEAKNILARIDHVETRDNKIVIYFKGP